MTLPVVVLVLLGVIAAIAIGRRLIGRRSDEQAMESYEHALGVLGETSRRSDSSAGVRVIPPDKVAKAHIKPADGTDEAVLRPQKGEDVPPPRIRLEPPVLPGVPPNAPLYFGTPAYGTPAVPPSEDEMVAASAAGEPERALSFDDVSPAAAGAGAAALAGEGYAGRQGTGREGSGAGAHPSSSRPAGRSRRPAATQEQRRHDRRVRLAATGGLAAVAVAAIVVASLELAGGSGGKTPPHAGGSVPTTSSTASPSTTTPTTSLPTTTTLKTTGITPQTASATEVSYVAPGTTYTLTFQAVGRCWIGIQDTATGPWVWMDTLNAGQEQTYSATGNLVVRLGAPPEIKVSIDGITVELPPSNVQPYDLTFTPAS